MPLLAILLAFGSFPGANALRPTEKQSVVDRAFFTADTRRLVAVDRIEFNAAETAQPVIDEAQTRVYLPTRDGRLTCRYGDQTAWVFTAPSSGALLASPLLDEKAETLYVPSSDGTVSALNRITGKVRWQTELKEELTTTPTLVEGSEGVGAEQRTWRYLFVMSSEDAVTALDAATGKTLWKFRRERPGGFTLRGNARPVYAHKLLYTAFSDGFVVALKPADGAARWLRNVSGAGDYLDVDQLAASEDDHAIYVASAKEGVLALDAVTGDSLWTTALPGANHVILDGPRVVVTGKGAVAAFSRRSGKLLWTTKLPKDAYATEPVATEGLVLVSEDHGALIALSALTGRPRSSVSPGVMGFSMPVVTLPGLAYIVSNDGVLFSLGLLP